MACFCRSSGWCVAVGAGIAGLVGGFAASRALESAPPAASNDAAVLLASFLQPEGEQPSAEQMMEMMKEWAAPVAEHEVLKQLVGTWDCETKFWMGPGEPTVSAGVSEQELVLGGRYVTQHFTMPDMMGMPFEGMGATGYDKAKGKYSAVWIDNFSTGFSIMEGEYDKAAKTMTWTGTSVYPDGQGGTIETPVKHIIKHVSKDKTVMEFWEPMAPGGEQVRTGEITYTRRK